VPLLGTEYAWNADGTVLTITTRDGVKWSDGEAFSAKDVAFTLDMIAKNPAINAVGYAGTAVAPDATHVVVTFPEPAYMDAPQLLGKTFIVPEHIWSTIADPATDTMAKPIGTGPYTLGEFKPQAYTLTANPTYWGGEPAVKSVRYLSMSGSQAGADALGAGQIDWQTGPVPDIANVEKNYPGYKSITTPLNQMALFTCSNADLGCTGAQTDPAVRQAIYYGMDRTQLNALAFEKTASDMSPGLALMPRDEAFVSSKLTEKTAPTGPEAAKATKLLEGAGWAKGSDGIYAKDGKRLAMTVKVVTGWTDYITAVDTMSQQLKAIGIEITAQQVSWNEWADARGQGQFELLIDSLNGGPSADPYVMDEPTTALDVVVQRGILREILREILRLREELGFAVIFITHDLPLLLELSDRIAIMLRGEIVELAAADDIYERPQHAYTRKLLDAFPSLTGERGSFIRSGVSSSREPLPDTDLTEVEPT
jgi:peptide/nickel transport system substrate-binding protein